MNRQQKIPEEKEKSESTKQSEKPAAEKLKHKTQPIIIANKM